MLWSTHADEIFLIFISLSAATGRSDLRSSETGGDHVKEGTAGEQTCRERNQWQENPLKCGLLENQHNASNQWDYAHYKTAANNPGERAHFEFNPMSARDSFPLVVFECQSQNN